MEHDPDLGRRRWGRELVWASLGKSRGVLFIEKVGSNIFTEQKKLMCHYLILQDQPSTKVEYKFMKMHQW
jgi:hypothetical protein